MRAGGAASPVATVLLFGVNFVATLGIVWVNKGLSQFYHYYYSTFNTMINFVFTFLCSFAASKAGFFEHKRVSIVQVLPVSVALCLSVAFSNLSLQMNSVGFYQVCKLLGLPFMLFVETTFYGKSYTLMTKLSIVPVLVGAALTSGTDYQFNVPGLIVALVAVVANSLYGVWAGADQRRLEVNSLQLLLYQSPLSSLLMIVVVPMFDSVPGVLSFPYTPPLLMMIVLSGLFAFVVNFSSFFLIGATSAVTFSVVGNMKTVMIVVMGFVLFGAPVEAKNVLGILLTLVGVFAYSHFKIAAPPSTPPVPPPAARGAAAV